MKRRILANREAEERRRLAAIDRSVSNYYTNLSKKDERELSAWGRFSMRQMRRTKGRASAVFVTNADDARFARRARLRAS
jgi:hypothetical protein